MAVTSKASTSGKSAPKKGCPGRTKSGRPCAARPSKSGWCAFHDPALGRVRALGHKRGGERRRTPSVSDTSQVHFPIRESAGVMQLLDVAAGDTLAQPNGALRTRGLVAVAMAYLKGIEVGQLEQRIDSIERLLSTGGHE